MLIDTQFSALKLSTIKSGTTCRIEDIKPNTIMKLLSWSDMLSKFSSTQLSELGLTEERWRECSGYLRIGRIIYDKLLNAKDVTDICHIKNGVRIPVGALYNFMGHFTVNGVSNKRDISHIATEADIQEMISKVDKEVFRTAVSGYMKSSKKPQASDVAIDNILREWAVNKFPIYKTLGRELIQSKSTHIDINEKTYNKMIEDMAENFPEFKELLTYIDRNNIKNNVCLDNELVSQVFEEYKVGMKFSKFIARLFNNSKLDIELSKIMQNKKELVTDTISIHPMDYLTMSYNKHSWSSCHHMLDGGYRSAVFSYMFDNMALISYRCSDKKYTYTSNYHNDFEWNSKRERSILFIDTTLSNISINHSYPSSERNADLHKSIANCISELMSENLGISSNWRYCSNPDKERLMRKGVGGHYTDPVASLLVNCDYEATYNIFNIGSSKIFCLNCGKPLSSSSYSLCGECACVVR